MKSSTNFQSGIKKIIFAAFALLISFQSFAWNGPDVQKLLEQSFEKSFPNAERVTWSNDAGGYTVCFTVNRILTRLSYDKKGNFTGSLRNYTGETLPFFITNLLKQKYSRYQIFGITEIASPTTLIYFVKMEGVKYWITVQVDNDGNNTIVEKFRKQQ